MRFELIFDAGDWIVDTETGEYIHLEEACSKLNDYEESLGVVGGFIKDFDRLLDEANKGGVNLGT